MAPPRSFVICTTPRSGSTLLCALLAASGQGGRPESWYRAEDRAEYEADWSVASGDSAGFLAGALRAGTGPDGSFGLRLQATCLPGLLAELTMLFGPLPDRALMTRAFGPCDYIYLRRRDDVAQAVSRLKAETSRIWHLDGSEPDRPAVQPRYDAARLDAFRAEAAAGNLMWNNWFAQTRLHPRRLVYESFAVDPAGQTAAVLAEFGQPLSPDKTLSVPNRRMADKQSAEWAARYRAERDLPPPAAG